MRILWLLVAGVLLVGCGGGESGSSVSPGSKPGAGTNVPVPATPQEPGEDDEEDDTTTDTSGRLISSASGSTPPPPPTIVR